MAEVNVTPASPVQVARVTLTSTQVLNIRTTPVTIVPAPGAGLVIVPVAGFVNYTFVTTAYTDHGGSLILGWNNALGASLGVQTLGFWTAASSQAALLGFSGSPVSAITLFANLPLTIGQNTASPTLGDGTLTVTVFYGVVAVS